MASAKPANLSPVSRMTKPAALAAATAATREQGYANGSGGSGFGNGWGLAADDEVPELRWPLSVAVYDRMRRSDPKVRSVLRAVKSPLLATQWRLDPAGSDPEVYLFVSRELGLPVKGLDDTAQVAQQSRVRGRFSWTEHLRLALLHLDFGHSVFEQVYRFDETTGRYHLRKLGERLPRTISKWDVARDGGLNAVHQYSTDSAAGKEVVMRINRLVVYAHEREGAEWWGQSLLRSAYKDWLLKDRLLRVDTMAIERNGMGIPKYTAPQIPDNLPGGQDRQKLAQDHIDAGLEIVTELRSGENAGASLTHGSELELMGVTGTLPAALTSIQYHDDMIATAVLANFLNLGRQTGSWALGTTFADFFTSSLNQIGRYVCDVGTSHIVEDLVDLNFGEDVPAPKLVFDDLAGKDQALAYAIKSLVDAGIISPDQSLETFMRSAYRLPQAPEGDKDKSDQEDQK